MEEQGQAPDLRALREAQDLDLASLSSATSLSVAQLRELEEGGSGHFYSEAIKQQALRRVLRHLGVETPNPNAASSANASTSASSDEASPPLTQGGVIQGIIRLSQSGDQYEDPRFPISRSLALPSGVVWFASAIVLGIVLIWTYPYEGVQSAANELKAWLTPNSTETVVVQADVTTVTTAPVTAQAQAESSQTTKDAAGTPAGSDATNKNEALSSAKDTQAPAPAPNVPASGPSTSAVPTVQTPAPVANAVPAPAPAASALSTSNTTAVACESFKAEPVLVKPISVEKQAQFVYVLAKAPTVLCATDGQGKTTRLELTPGVGRSIYGPAPWVLANANWADLDLFFQGAKVWIPAGTPSRVRLNEQPVNKPSSPAQTAPKN